MNITKIGNIDKIWNEVTTMAMGLTRTNPTPYSDNNNLGFTLGIRLKGIVRNPNPSTSYHWYLTEHCKSEFILAPGHKKTPFYWHHMNDENELLILLIRIDEPFINSISSDAFSTLTELEHKVTQGDTIITKLTGRLHNELINNDPFSKASLKSLKQQFVVHLLRQYCLPLSSSENSNTEGLSKEQLNRVNEYIETHFFEDITLKDLAGLLSMSEYHFSRQYKKSSQITPYQHILNCRLFKAQQLLETSDLRIQQIAYKVGYKDSSSFSKAFRKFYGTTAGNYRRQLVA